MKVRFRGRPATEPSSLGRIVSKRDQKKLEARIGVFLRKYGRKTHPNHDPNDRSFDRDVEKLIKQMDPAELDRLMNDETDESAT